MNQACRPCSWLWTTTATACALPRMVPQYVPVPALTVLCPHRCPVRWVDGGLAPGPIWNPIGLRSPMLGYASSETSIASKVFFARTGLVQAFAPGITCPTTNPLFSCSGHGSCNCLAGTCSCEALSCFYGDDCGTEQVCNMNGFCLQGTCGVWLSATAVWLPLTPLTACVRYHRPVRVHNSVLLWPRVLHT